MQRAETVPGARFVFLAILALTALGAAWPHALSAQAGQGTFVAVPEAFPPIEARAMVVREPGIDMVVLKAGEETLDALSMALHVLRDARERVAVPDGGILIPITGFVVTKAVEGPARRALEETLRRLADAPPEDLGSLGMGRRVRLPGR